ncbi:hypothetical protein ABVK25_001105 [Lepraria finkii]|uniref:Uncharacterized protein n=1 Tax=Lepraria finkii TaxID=1340010 RepID=A0ABR4BKN2_9LECA
MAIWPFGRKSKKNKKSEEQAMAASRAIQPDTTRRDSVRGESDRSAPALVRKPSRKENQRRRRSSTGKLTKVNHSRTRDSEKVEAISAVPAIPQAHKQNELNEKTGSDKENRQITTPPYDRGDIPSYYFQNPMSASSLQPEKVSVRQSPPTLHGKRSANDQGIMRRKSSKRKADDHAREQEIKTMSSPIMIPTRPSSHNPGNMARDSKKVPGGLNRNFDRPLSDISLPMGESLHSTMSVSSDQHAFKVSAFDVLSPRPTIRYTENPRSASNSIGGPSRTSTRKDKQPMIPEEEGKRLRRRIDDLADDMDAGTIKELMERDRRRREQKRKSDREKVDRKLQRRADKQRERDGKTEEATGADVDRRPTREKEDDVGVGIGGASTAPEIAESSQEVTRAQAVKSPDSWFKDTSRENLARYPFQDPVAGSATSHLEAPSIAEERDEPIVGTAKEVRLSQTGMSPPMSPTHHVREPSNLSQYQELASSRNPDIPELVDPDPRRDSETTARLQTGWRSIFRRSGTNARRNSSDRGRATPSEFSNTSRESVARNVEGRQMPPSAFTRIPRARSGTPIRTQSRFKEDLPGLPLSPPDFQMQYPDVRAQSPLPGIPGSRLPSRGTDIASNAALSEIHPAFREEVTLSRNASLRANSPEGPASAIMSQSLASVDSEGSWLTGRPVKRLSQPQPRESASSLQQRSQEQAQMDDAEEEEIPGTPEEEKYMGTLTPAPDEAPRIPQRKRPFMGAAANIGGDSDVDSTFQSATVASTAAQEEGKWHGTVGKHPTIVRQGPGPRAKSREGLLNEFPAAEESAESSPTGDSPMGDSPVSPENPYPTIQRATSVDVGKGHARHISAGSARLLNLPPRSSGESKRFSASSGASGERSPLVPSMPSPRMPETHEDDVD